MPIATVDATGFQLVCSRARFRWVRVSFILALSKRGGPAPRCQDLPVGTFIDGVVPPGVCPWVVSYCWSAHLHPFPGSAKLTQLANTLMRLGAKESDVVFVDYMSLPQGLAVVPAIYQTLNEGVQAKAVGINGQMVELPDRTQAERRQFGYALFETTRLYAFRGGTLPDGQDVLGCRVLVLPTVDPPEGFPDVGKISKETNYFCEPARQEQRSRWGFSKSVSYHLGGWTCAEYAVARKCGTIYNKDDAEVQRVATLRTWPDTVQEYADMMSDDAAMRVTFTKKGDRDAVRFNFFKYTHEFNEQLRPLDLT